MTGEGSDQIRQETGGDPFTCLEQLDKSGVLSLVMPERMELSGRRIRRKNRLPPGRWKRVMVHCPSARGWMGWKNGFCLTNIS